MTISIDKNTIITFLKKLYIEMMPYNLIFTSVAIVIITFLNQDCTIDPSVLSYLPNTLYNSTIIQSDETRESLSKSLSLICSIFGIQMVAYSKIMKKNKCKSEECQKILEKEKEVLEKDNISLNSHLETLTQQLGLEYTHLNPSIIGSYHPTIYNQPIHIHDHENEPIEDLERIETP
jgi:hypothetical protein